MSTGGYRGCQQEAIEDVNRREACAVHVETWRAASHYRVSLPRFHKCNVVRRRGDVARNVSTNAMRLDDAGAHLRVRPPQHNVIGRHRDAHRASLHRQIQ